MTKLNHALLVAAFVLGANVASAASVSVEDGRGDSGGRPDATALVQFYPTPLATSPVGAIEDKAVWLAKVQGLIEDAPPLLQKSILASKTQKQFAANLGLLEQLQQGALQKGIVAAKSVAKAGKLAPKEADGKPGPNLGNGPGDTVFTALEPCRIMDSRNATAGSGVRGPLIGDHLYQLPSYIATGSNWGIYGGNATSDCGLNGVAGPNTWAIALVITILNPNFDAFLGVGDTDTLAATLSTVALNYTRGQGLSTLYIVPQTKFGNTIYFAMPAQLTANIIFDVVGYFAASQATALDCVTVVGAGIGTNDFPAGLNLVVPFPSCPVGYVRSGVGCSSPGSTSGIWLSQNSPTQSNCIWHNNNTAGNLSTSQFKAEAICCRISGRP